MPQVIEVIVGEELRGTGKDNDPIRTVTTYYDFDGKLLAYSVDGLLREQQYEYLKVLIAKVPEELGITKAKDKPTATEAAAKKKRGGRPIR